MSSLEEKLRSLGVKKGTNDLPVPGPAAQIDFAIENVVTGRFLSTSLGDTYICESHFKLDHLHGSVPILFSEKMDMLSLWAGNGHLTGMKPEDFVFLDTETSGLAGGTGTYAFMVGVGHFTAEDFHLVQFFMRDPGEEGALLEALTGFMASARVMVTYNGKAFDAPLLKTRYSLHSLPVPFQDLIHLDLLPLARRLWRDRLPSRSLKYIEENVLGAPRGNDEVPGYEIPYLYFDYLRTGDARPLAGVFYHNSMDIVALAAMLNHMNHMLAEPMHESIEHGLDRIALAKLFEDLGQWDQAARLYECGLQEELPPLDFSQAIRRLSILQRRRGDLQAAMKLWEKAASDGHVYAHVELAKYHEHRLGDPSTAIGWTKAARQLVQKDESMPVYMRQHWLDEINHRLDRLENKLRPPADVGEEIK